MKIYQIHEYGGEWEDSYDWIIASYLSKEKAEARLLELEYEELLRRKCDKCPLYLHYDEDISVIELVALTKEYCNKCEPDDPLLVDDDIYIECKNYDPPYDFSYYKIVEIEVIE